MRWDAVSDFQQNFKRKASFQVILKIHWHVRDTENISWRVANHMVMPIPVFHGTVLLLQTVCYFVYDLNHKQRLWVWFSSTVHLSQRLAFLVFWNFQKLLTRMLLLFQFLISYNLYYGLYNNGSHEYDSSPIKTSHPALYPSRYGQIWSSCEKLLFQPSLSCPTVFYITKMNYWTSKNYLLNISCWSDARKCMRATAVWVQLIIVFTSIRALIAMILKVLSFGHLLRDTICKKRYYILNEFT